MAGGIRLQNSDEGWDCRRGFGPHLVELIERLPALIVSVVREAGHGVKPVAELPEPECDLVLGGLSLVRGAPVLGGICQPANRVGAHRVEITSTQAAHRRLLFAMQPPRQATALVNRLGRNDGE